MEIVRIADFSASEAEPLLGVVLDNISGEIKECSLIFHEYDVKSRKATFFYTIIVENKSHIGTISILKPGKGQIIRKEGEREFQVKWPSARRKLHPISPKFTKYYQEGFSAILNHVEGQITCRRDDLLYQRGPAKIFGNARFGEIHGANSILKFEGKDVRHYITNKRYYGFSRCSREIYCCDLASGACSILDLDIEIMEIIMLNDKDFYAFSMSHVYIPLKITPYSPKNKKKLHHNKVVLGCMLQIYGNMYLYSLKRSLETPHIRADNFENNFATDNKNNYISSQTLMHGAIRRLIIPKVRPANYSKLALEAKVWIIHLRLVTNRYQSIIGKIIPPCIIDLILSFAYG